MSDAEKKPSLEDRVRDWISTQGYPLEFYAADAFSREGFSVRQGVYVEQEGDKPRELDVMAEKESGNAKCTISVYYLIECKYSKSKPWVIFSSLGRIQKPHILQMRMWAHNPGTEEILNKLVHDPDLGRCSMFNETESYGFNARQAFIENGDNANKNSFDVCYSTIQAIASVARFLAKKSRGVREFVHHVQPGGRSISYHYSINLFFPLIVVDGSLFDASYDESSEKLLIRELPSKQLRWQGLGGNEGPVCIDIVSKANLRDFVKKRNADLAILQNKISSVVSDIP